jgi:hypothetical protein
MRRIAFFLVCTLLFASVTLAQQTLSREQIRSIARSVVMIEVLDDDRDPFGFGSGTLVTETGRILTNRHVIERGEDFGIYMLGDLAEPPELLYYASLVGVADEIDLAVLQIDRDENGDELNSDDLRLPFMEAFTDDVLHGDYLYIFGFPGIGDGYLVVTQGSITTIENDDVGDERLPIYFQTDAEISPGNSGGLVVNANGAFVGIPTFVRSEIETLGRLGGITPYPVINYVLENDLLIPSDISENSFAENRPNDRLSGGLEITCAEAELTNAVEFVIVQMRAGFTYTATAVGLDGFDPVMQVFNRGGGGRGLCSDDAEDATDYVGNLPSTGSIPSSTLSSQIQFAQETGNNMGDVAIRVGGYGDRAGEFLLVLEGMAVTEFDGQGDPFGVSLVPGMVGYGIPLTVYMLSDSTTLDPFLYLADYLADEDGDIQELDNGRRVFCDDAGVRALCFGDSEDLDGSELCGTSLDINSSELDAMLRFPLGDFDSFELNDYYLNFMMTSSGRESSGDYVIAFHVGTQ